MDRRLRNRILVFLALAGVAAYGLIRLSQRQPVAKISAVNPIREDLVSSISSNGKVEPITPYVVRAQLDTFVESVRAVEGQQVKKGELLLELDVKDAQARLAEARAALLRAQDDLRAALGGGRADEAAKADGALAAAKAEFDRGVKLDASRAELQVEQQRAMVASLEEKVRDGRIVAPVNGTLYSLPVKKGDFVKQGDLLAEMVDLHQVRVRAFIDDPELGGLEPGEPVRITWDALPNRVW